jgi:putative FmdB family regulatory protein
MDALQKMNDDPLVDCPACGKPELRKLLSAPRFRLKGKGWYETDFKKDNQRNLHDDSKPAAKKDKKPDDAGKAKDAKSATTPKSDSSGSKSD